MFYRNGSFVRKLILLRILAGGSSATTLTVTGISPLALVNSLAHAIKSFTQFGKCVQNGADIMCNNGALKYGATGKNLFDIPASVTKDGITFTKDSDGYVTASPSNGDPRSWGKNNAQFLVNLAPGNYKFVIKLKTPSASQYSGWEIYSPTGVKIAGSSGGKFRADEVAAFTASASGNYYIMAKMHTSASRLMVVKDGADTSNYEPYTEGIYTDGTPEVLTITATGAETQTVSDIPNLFSTLDGSVRDEVDFVSGVVTRRTEAVYEDGGIVVKALAEPVTEQTTPHSLHSYKGTTIVTAQTNVDPVTLKAEYKGVAA